MRLDIHPFNNLADAIAWAGATIDGGAARARGRHISHTHGQEHAYLAKTHDAVAYRNAGFPEDGRKFPWVSEEAKHSGRTLREVALAIIDKGTVWWDTTAPAIEGLRVGAKARIAKASTIPEAVRLARQYESMLNEI